MKYLRNRLTVDDGTGGTDEGNKKTFDIPKLSETEDERKRRLYTEHHVVRSTGTFDIRYTRIWIGKNTHVGLNFSCKNVSSLSDESIEIISKEKPSHVNLAKNKFTEMPVV